MEISPAAHDLYGHDPTVSTFGIELRHADADRSVVRMTVRDDMCNGFGIIHGGMTFLLADSAMAFASNSEGTQALATSAGIDWVAPAQPGDELTATAVRAGGSRRSAIWDITVVNQHGDTVAIVRGRTRQVAKRSDAPA